MTDKKIPLREGVERGFAKDGVTPEKSISPPPPPPPPPPARKK